MKVGINKKIIVKYIIYKATRPTIIEMKLFIV